ncbi:MAG: hypothetical protein J0M12_16470 [Deltaproteobacteria bacterium]|nr:hypothetical protein [Deltaproteobacteria bacterium]
MAQAFTPGLLVKPSLSVKRLRELPVPGEVVVQVGDSVRAEQVVARAFLPGDLHILRIAEKLGVEAFEVMKGLKVKVGDAIQVNQVLCEHSGLFGLFKSRFESPVEGILELVAERTGHVAVRCAAKPIEVHAFIDGKISAIDPKKSVTVSTSAAFVQGIFGVGGERCGIVKLLASKGSKFEASDLPADVSGCVIVCRTRPTLETLQVAAQRGAVALVTGSIDDEVLAGYLGFDLGIALTGDEDVPMTVIISEGFGDLLMSDRVYELLSKLDGKRASVNGATQVRAGALRPEIVVPESDSAVMPAQPEQNRGLTLGAAIRIIRVPYFGKYASVHELPQEMQQIETGAYARILKAKLADGRIVTVPRANVELV